MWWLFLGLGLLVLWWYKRKQRPNYLSAIPPTLLQKAQRGPSRQVLALYNPISQKSHIAETLAFLCTQISYNLQLVATTHQGHAESLARELSTLPDLLVCIGGDGLLNELINGLLANPLACQHQHIRIPILILPTGTGNGVATSMGLSLSNAFAALLHHRPTKVDLMTLTSPSYSRHALLSVNWALVADIDALSERQGRHWPLRTLWIPLYRILRNRAYAGTLEFRLCPAKKFQLKSPHRTRIRNGQEWMQVRGAFRLVTMMNLPWLASDVLLAPNVQSGAMLLLFVQEASRWDLVQLFLQAEKGQHLQHRVVEYASIVEGRLIPDEKDGHVVYDGEMAPCAATHVTMVPQAVSVLTGSDKTNRL